MKHPQRGALERLSIRDVEAEAGVAMLYSRHQRRVADRRGGLPQCVGGNVGSTENHAVLMSDRLTKVRRRQRCIVVEALAVLIDDDATIRAPRLDLPVLRRRAIAPA